MTSQLRPCLLILACLTIQLWSWGHVVAQTAGKSARADELNAYHLRQQKGVRISRSYRVDADEKGIPNPGSKVLQRIRHFDEKGHYLTDTVFGDKPGEIIASTRHQYHRNYISGYQVSFALNGDFGSFRIQYIYDEKDMLRHSVKLEGETVGDTTGYFYDEAGELLSQIRYKQEAGEKNDTTLYSYNKEGKLAGMEQRSSYLIHNTEYSYDENGRLSVIRESTLYKHGGPNENYQLVYRYRDDDLCRQIEWYNDKNLLERIYVYEYLDKNGVLIQP